MATKRLDAAKDNKDDEFYTQLSDIEKELSHYKEYFENKIPNFLLVSLKSLENLWNGRRISRAAVWLANVGNNISQPF